MSGSAQDSRSVVEAWYAALAAGDIQTVTDTLDEDVVVNVVGRTPVSGRHAGRAAFVAGAMGPIFAALDPESVQFATRWTIFAADGDHVAALMEGRAATKDGKRYDNTYCHLFTIVDGRITELYEFLDTALVHEAIFANPLARSERDPVAPLAF